MASDIAREESFRTSLRNQRRRLSATERRPSIPDIGLTKPSTPDIRLEFWDIDELSPLSTPAGSPPRSPSPYELVPRCISRSPSPCSMRSPIPSSSPLLCPNTASPALKRVKSFNKELRRARSFRAAREKSSSRQNSAVNSRLGVFSDMANYNEIFYILGKSLLENYLYLSVEIQIRPIFQEPQPM